MNKTFHTGCGFEEQRILVEGQRRLLLERESRGLPLDRRSVANLLRILEPLSAGGHMPAFALEPLRR
jgi:hypothetical protein